MQTREEYSPIRFRLGPSLKMIKINKERFFYIILAIMIIDLMIDGIDDFGTKLYLIHLIRNVLIISMALILSINFKKAKKK